MKKFYTILVMLAIVGLSANLMYAQNTYTITRKGIVGNIYFVNLNGTNLFGGASAREIQVCIEGQSENRVGKVSLPPKNND